MRRNEKEITDKVQMLDIIGRSDVCRIALTNDDVPYIVTMNFGHSGDFPGKLFFHCASEGRKLGMLKKNNYVCFEMDIDHKITRGSNGCDWGMEYKSIVGYGRMRIITGIEEKSGALDLIMDHYGGKGNYDYDAKTLERTTVLMLEITEITGKKC